MVIGSTLSMLWLLGIGIARADEPTFLWVQGPVDFAGSIMIFEGPPEWNKGKFNEVEHVDDLGDCTSDGNQRPPVLVLFSSVPPQIYVDNGVAWPRAMLSVNSASRKKGVWPLRGSCFALDGEQKPVVIVYEVWGEE